MKRLWTPALAAVLLAQSLAANGAQKPDEVVSTVGIITENNGLQKNGRLVVKTPSILRASSSETVKPDPRAAIEQYDRLLELSPDAEVRAEAMRRSADLRVQLADTEGGLDEAEVRKAIDIYNQLLTEVPNGWVNDRALYQLARAYQLVGDDGKATVALRTLGTKYPNSIRAGDALFRVAELLYRQGEYAEAETQYKAVVNMGQRTPFIGPAQYKYGWSLYKQGKYEQALPLFMAILDRELPQGNLEDPQAALSAVNKDKAEMATDSLRVTALSFAALGGGKAINDYFSKKGEPRFSTLLYNAAGALLLEKRRYTDAAGVYAAFIERHPEHPQARNFQTRMVAIYQKGGFSELVIQAEEASANRYLSANKPGSRPVSPEMLAEQRKNLDDLGRYYQAKAQKEAGLDAAARRANFLAAAGWYRRILDLYPQDPRLAEINLLYADSLYDGGQLREAAEQYQRCAYAYGSTPKASEAAYAAIQAYQRLAKEAAAGERADILRLSVAASAKLADTYPAHPQWVPVLARASEDLYEVKDYEPAARLAVRVLQSNATVTAAQRSEMLGVQADSNFALARYADAETAYRQLQAVTPAGSAEYKTIASQLTASSYKQGEAARASGDLRAAAQSFQRAGQASADAGVRASAEYDAASAYMGLKDWPAAELALETFRNRYPANPLAADADKKLALAYQNDSKPGMAGAVYQRIAQRTTETADTRRESAWLAATLYDKAGLPQSASKAYESYLHEHPQELDRAETARGRLAAYALASNDRARYLALQRDIISADTAAGAARTDLSKLAAAQACLELGRIDAANARSLALTIPLNKSLPKRKTATETAIASLARAAGYGFAEITTAATYEIGAVYSDFGRALTASERPKLKGDELAQYNLLLEEQAEPFEEKAIEAHEANLQRAKQGISSDWINRSAAALAQLAPAKYAQATRGLP